MIVLPAFLYIQCFALGELFVLRVPQHKGLGYSVLGQFMSLLDSMVLFMGGKDFVDMVQARSRPRGIRQLLPSIGPAVTIKRLIPAQVNLQPFFNTVVKPNCLALVDRMSKKVVMVGNCGLPILHRNQENTASDKS